MHSFLWTNPRDTVKHAKIDEVEAELRTGVARHARFETTLKHYAKGDVQKAAAKLRKPSGSTVPGYTEVVESS
jgi:hypothetical protein